MKIAIFMYMIMIMKRYIYLFLGLFVNLGTYANNDPFGAWYMYFGNIHFQNTSWRASYDFQYRNHNMMGDLNQLLLRGGIQYTRIDNLTLGAGYAFVLSEKKDLPNEPFRENRLYQDILTNQTIGKNNVLKHRFRFEQRFIESQDIKTRLRYQLAVEIPIFTQVEKQRMIYAVASNELFMNTDRYTRKNNAFDRNRVFFGASFKWNKNTGIQLGWMNQLLQQNSAQQLMVSFHQNIQL